MKVVNGHLVIKRGEINFIEILGWYGIIAIIVAYLLLSLDVVTSLTPSYQVLNLTGAIAIIIHSLKKKDYQPAVLNVLWALIAVFAIARIIFKF